MLLLALAAGCGAGEPVGYDPALRYPLRADPVVVRPPAEQPSGYPPPGRLDESIAALTGRGGELVSPDDVPADERAKLDQALGDLFGTPAAPLAAGVSGAGGFDLSPAHLAAGSRLYRRHCQSCHGLGGSGRGPTAPWTQPYPRDFRVGVFKAGVGDNKPTPDQFARLLRQGVPGSSMPLFDLLPTADVDAVSAYVVHLSLRGEAEAAGLRAGVDGDAASEAARRAAAAAVSRWDAPKPPEPAVAGAEPDQPGYADAVRRGKELFHAAAAGCASCHQDYGRHEAYRYDVWGAPVRVHDLTRGEFRWGKADAAIAARVRHGIPVAGMPSNPHLSDEQVRDLVTFVRDLGLLGRLPPDVRAQVYPQTAGR